MRSRIVFFILVIILFAEQKGFGQFQYQYDLDIPVTVASNALEEPWSGGLNLGQYNAVHLNDDDILDLVIFDRHNNKALTYLSDGTNYHYTPKLEHLLPSGLRNWVLFRDFNCDGKQDIFTSSLFGMSLYENTSSGALLSWELKYSTIFTEGESGGQVNLQVNSGDLPSINDIDGDGDLDILVFDFAVGGGVNLHKNWSIERTGQCDMDLVFDTDRYGDFEECTCETYVFGMEECPTSGRLLHSGGKSILSYSSQEGSAQDLFIGQEDCINFGFLENQGSVGSPIMPSVRFDFPEANNPIRLNYPAAFNLDLDFDGQEDLLITHNAFSDFGMPDYSHNNLFYKKTGSGYSLQSNSFMQDRMIDLGYNASPAFADVDGDGDQEMFVGAGSKISGARLYYFNNNGDALNPTLDLQNSNYLDLEAEDYEFIKPQFIDLNQDGNIDLILVLSTPTTSVTTVYWNTNNPLNPYSSINSTELSTPNFVSLDNPYFFYGDNGLNMLIGRTTGNLSQYINRASIDNPQWELISNSFLGISENFMARNLSVAIDDLNADGKNDMVTYNDSGKLLVYNDYNNDGGIIENILVDTLTFEEYNSSFGFSSRVTTTKISGARLPSIAIGLRTGGLNLLKNLDDDQQNIEVPIRLSTFPNPVAKDEALQLVANKTVSFTIFDTKGNILSDTITLPKGEKLSLDIMALNSGLYLIQAVDSVGNKAGYKFIITN
jgi:hypothetical protein